MEIVRSWFLLENYFFYSFVFVKHLFWYSVDGGLTEWGEWGNCDKLCEPGKQRRYKTCTNPKRRCDGKLCDPSIQTVHERDCMSCPVKWVSDKENDVSSILIWLVYNMSPPCQCGNYFTLYSNYKVLLLVMKSRGNVAPDWCNVKWTTEWSSQLNFNYKNWNERIEKKIRAYTVFKCGIP